MIDDPDRCYAAVRSRDERFDGRFVLGVTSTGIYCRPSCPAVTPRRANVRFHATAAAAQEAGFRACKRCRPDASPGSPDWDVRADLAGRAMRLVADGVVDREGVEGLAARLGYTPRHLRRVLVAEVGAGPHALARAQRARTARVLVETTALPLAEVAFAAGFASVRRFNEAVRSVYGATPSQLRASAGARGTAHPGGDGEWLTLRLPYRRPAALEALLDHLEARAVPGVEERVDRSTYRRALTLPRGGGVVELELRDREVRARVRLDDLRDLTAAVQRCRRLLDLDADPAAVDEHLGGDPHLAAAVRATPGRRQVHHPDDVEVVLRTVLGQQVSIAAARTQTGRLVTLLDTRLDRPVGGVTHRLPTPAELAAVDPHDLPLPASRARALVGAAGALRDGTLRLDVGADRDEVRARLADLPGFGAWSRELVAMRGLGDPDAFPATDLALRRGAARLGLPDDPRGLTVHAERWRPWRSYAAAHLWAAAAGVEPTVRPGRRERPESPERPRGRVAAA
jgi:AraC family transcriptional regulator of adaptative response / DNA-3-methyladenine glycosylase II